MASGRPRIGRSTPTQKAPKLARRQIAQFAEEKAALQRNLAALEAKTASALAESSAAHARELRAVQVAAADQERIGAAAQQTRAEAATRQAQAQIEQLQRELTAARAQAAASAAAVAVQPSVELAHLTIQLEELRAKYSSELSLAAATAAERDVLREQAAGWAALFSKEGLLRARCEESAPAKALPLLVFEALAAARGEGWPIAASTAEPKSGGVRLKQAWRQHGNMYRRCSTRWRGADGSGAASMRTSRRRAAFWR